MADKTLRMGASAEEESSRQKEHCFLSPLSSEYLSLILHAIFLFTLSTLCHLFFYFSDGGREGEHCERGSGQR